jgi:hypothetical protein
MNIKDKWRGSNIKESPKVMTDIELKSNED